MHRRLLGRLLGRPLDRPLDAPLDRQLGGPAASLLRAAPIVLFAAWLAACSGGQGPAGPSGPRWEGVHLEAFPDDIAPKALGLPDASPRPGSDPALRQRALSADVVARVRVQTVSVERRSNGDPVYRIGLQLASPRLVEREELGDVVEILVVPGGAAHGLARAWDVRLSGKTFVGFLRKFVDAEGQPVVHFHLAPDDEAVASAVQQVVALEEVKGR